jgi:hypothetical protein
VLKIVESGNQQRKQKRKSVVARWSERLSGVWKALRGRKKTSGCCVYLEIDDENVGLVGRLRFKGG